MNLTNWNPTIPSIYQIEAHSHCNFSCNFCWTGINNHLGLDEQYNKFAMDMDLFELIVKRDLQGSKFIELQMRGEPTLNKNLNKMVNLLRDKVYVGFSTHGGLLHIDHAFEAAINSHYLTISIDAGTKETYELKRRGGNWEKLVSNIDKLMEAKVRLSTYSDFPLVDLQLIEIDYPHRIWQEELILLQQLSEERGWQANIRTIPNTVEGWANPNVIVDNKELCLNPWLTVSIKANGDVVPCCMAFKDDPAMCYGNLREQSLEEIWNGEKVKNFRQIHLTTSVHQLQFWEHKAGKLLPKACATCHSKSPALLHDKLIWDALRHQIS